MQRVIDWFLGLFASEREQRVAAVEASYEELRADFLRRRAPDAVRAINALAESILSSSSTETVCEFHRRRVDIGENLLRKLDEFDVSIDDALDLLEPANPLALRDLCVGSGIYHRADGGSLAGRMSGCDPRIAERRHQARANAIRSWILERAAATPAARQDAWANTLASAAERGRLTVRR